VLERLERRQPEGLGEGRQDVHIRARIESVELRGGQEAREEESPRQAHRGNALLHRGEEIARARHGEANSRDFAGDARGRLEEVLGPLLARQSSGEENEGLAAREAPFPRAGRRVDRVVHDADPAAGHAVFPRQEGGRVA
jgi:hypothetical protein